MRWGSIIVVLLVLLPVEGMAGETIFDPENPAMQQDQQDQQDDDEDDDDDSLVIHDPERPDLPGDDDREEAEEPEKQEEPTAPETSEFRDTHWDFDYEVGMLADPHIGPEGRDVAEFVGAMGMELRHEMSEQTSARVAGRFGWWAGAGRQFDDWRTHYEPRLDRAYLVHRPGRWSLALGQMRNSWGSTDIIRPGDVIDPVDLRDPVGGDGFGTGMGQLSATGGYSGDDWSVRAVFVPFFVPNRVSVFGRDSSLMHDRNPVVGEQLPFLLAAEQFVDPSIQEEVQPVLQASSRPMHLPQNVSGGVRGSYTVSGTDLGVGIFYGWDRTPWIEMDEDMRRLLVLMGEGGGEEGEAMEHFENVSQKVADGEELIDSWYHRRATALFEVARYFGRIGVRADLALSPRQVFYTEELASVRRPSLFGAVGLSHERLLDGVRPLALTLEGFWLQPFGADSPVTRFLVAQKERGDPQEDLLLFEGGYYGVATAVNWDTGLWDLEITSGAIASISPGDVAGQFSLQRQWREGVVTRVGTNLFFGPDPARQLSPGGMWAHANRVYATVGGQF